MPVNIGFFDFGAHWRMWDWLSKHPGKRKADWPGWENYSDDVVDLCFACDSAVLANTSRGMCTTCPLEWPHRTRHWTPICPFYAWHEVTMRLAEATWSAGVRDTLLQQCVALAEQIRDMPLRKG